MDNSAKDMRVYMNQEQMKAEMDAMKARESTAVATLARLQGENNALQSAATDAQRKAHDEFVRLTKQNELDAGRSSTKWF